MHECALKSSSSVVSTLEGGAEADFGTDCGGLDGASRRGADWGGLGFVSCSA